eukprot:TRINITY_DN5491_c0_g1_i1.p3 TRINITY_DN5491_c0_g1~~TRINITY_DN5491_c0_g1_i1.p3  ORF type:complete len:52 (+),score=0.12 TRINITY_DN5491_c0_g1_i1:241-396(+)
MHSKVSNRCVNYLSKNKWDEQCWVHYDWATKNHWFINLEEARNRTHSADTL